MVQAIAATGRVVLDSDSARHEGGDLLQAGLDVAPLPTLGEVLARPPSDTTAGAVLFKSCGSALWDLAAAQCMAGR